LGYVLLFRVVPWPRESHDGHQERLWPSAFAYVVLMSDEYKLDSVGWRMERCEIQELRKSLFRR
jgi:hypothetical protein